MLKQRLVQSLSEDVFTEEIDCDDEDVFKAVDSALKKYNNGNQSGNQFVLYRIDNVTKTEDLNPFYSFTYLIKEGDCPVRSGKSWQDCGYKQSADAATGKCTVIVGKSKTEKFNVINQICEITPAEGPILMSRYNCLGCKHPVSIEDSGVEHVLRHGIPYFNNRSAHSHLFALKEVKAAYKQVVAGWNVDVVYSIMQTNCSKVDFPLLTPDCQALSNGDTADCMDRAYIDMSLRVASFSQQCDIFLARDFVPKNCVGCARTIPVNSSELDEVLNHSIKKLNAENNGTFYFKIDSVKKATVQTVAGLKYYIEFTATETTCSKENNTEFTSSCETKEPGQALTCNADIHVVHWENKIEPTVNCKTKMTMMRKRPPGFSPFRSALLANEREETTRQQMSCEYQVHPQEAGAGPAPGSEADSPQQAY